MERNIVSLHSLFSLFMHVKRLEKKLTQRIILEVAIDVNFKVPLKVPLCIGSRKNLNQRI